LSVTNPTTLIRVLFETFRPSKWYWQSIALMKSVLLIAVATYYSSNHIERFTAMTYFNLFAYLLHSTVRPHMHFYENWLEGVAHVSLLILTALLVPVDPPYDNTRAILVTFLVLPFAFAALVGIVVVRTEKKSSIAARIAKKLRLKAAEPDAPELVDLAEPALEEPRKAKIVQVGVKSPVASPRSIPLVIVQSPQGIKHLEDDPETGTQTLE
jgi:hypothetical protein